MQPVAVSSSHRGPWSPRDPDTKSNNLAIAFRPPWTDLDSVTLQVMQQLACGIAAAAQHTTGVVLAEVVSAAASLTVTAFNTNYHDRPFRRLRVHCP
jgi:hypothetical protein